MFFNDAAPVPAVPLICCSTVDAFVGTPDIANVTSDLTRNVALRAAALRAAGCRLRADP
jgi:hypothetical protein